VTGSTGGAPSAIAPPCGDWPWRFATDPGLSLAEIVRPFGVPQTLTFLDSTGRRRTLSYDRFAAHLATAADRLRRAGVHPGMPVATTIGTTMRGVIAALAVWVAGGTLVSVPPPPRRALRAEHGRLFGTVLSTMGCRFQVTHQDEEPLPGLTAIPSAALDGDDGVSPSDVDIPPVALVQFTSGSIGSPKGVAIGRDTLAGHLTMITRCMGLESERDVVATWLPFYHDFGLICFFLTALCGRVSQVHMGPRDFARDPSAWLRLLSTERATVTGGPHFGFALAGRVPYPDDLDLSRMRVALNGGERIHWSDLEDFQKVAGRFGFPWEAQLPVYGLAESTVGTTCTLRQNTGPVRGPGDLVSSGRPLPGSIPHCTGTPQAPANLHIGGRWLFDGYQTAAGFQPRTGEVFDTGDAGFLVEGETFVLGRSGDVVSHGGRNLFAEDVEAVALQAGKPWTHSCAAFKVDHGDQRFGLCVEAGTRDLPDSVGLAKAVRSAVAAALDTRVEPVLVVIPGSIPRTTSGKVQRGRCREAYLSGGLAGRKVLAELS
jgi:fatty-acyl-CoA synthase